MVIKQGEDTHPDLRAGTAIPPVLAIDVDVAGVSDRGKVRARNEDHFFVTRIGRYLQTAISSLPPGEIPDRTEEIGYALIVADGMGGHAGGEMASRTAIKELIKFALAMPNWTFKLDDTVASDASQRSRKRFRHVNSVLLAKGEQDPDLRGMGTTMTSARNMGRHLQIAHVGDSRAYLLRDGRLHRLTRDHTYAQMLVDCGRMTEQEAARFGARHLLVNALGGTNEEVEVDVDQLELVSGDRVLLCTDGLTDHVDDEAIRSALTDCRESQRACERLVELALAGGGRDNVTVVVATYTWQGGQ